MILPHSCTWRHRMPPGTAYHVESAGVLMVTVGEARPVTLNGDPAWLHRLARAPDDVAAVWEVLQS